MKKQTGRWFTTSDIHFCHNSIIVYCPGRGDTVEQMNETIIKNWNEDVSPDDNVIIVGDVMMGIIANNINMIRRLNGKKILVRGNHDKTLVKLLREPEHKDIFELVVSSYEKTFTVDGVKYPVLFSHYPYAHWSGQDRGIEYSMKTDGTPVVKNTGVIHFHGHLHSPPDRLHQGGTGRIMDIGMDGNGLRVWAIEDAINRVKHLPVKSNHHDI